MALAVTGHRHRPPRYHWQTCANSPPVRAPQVTQCDDGQRLMFTAEDNIKGFGHATEGATPLCGATLLRGATPLCGATPLRGAAARRLRRASP
jgi:hypothetical protein